MKINIFLAQFMIPIQLRVWNHNLKVFKIHINLILPLFSIIKTIIPLVI